MPCKVAYAAFYLLTDADFAVLQELKPVHRAHHRKMINHNQIFQSASLSPKETFEPEALAKVLDLLMDETICGEILRIKGFVRSESGSLSVNYTTGGRSVTPCASIRPMLNVIGRQLNRAQIKKMLQEAALHT